MVLPDARVGLVCRLGALGRVWQFRRHAERFFGESRQAPAPRFRADRAGCCGWGKREGPSARFLLFGNKVAIRS